jgi:DNA modification methylase
MIQRGHALDLLETLTEAPDLIVTDPPYAFGGTGDEHAISATVATVLRESARRLKKGRWMLVMCAASWRSTSYMVESVRGVVEPVRIATWCKPAARTKVRTGGWEWASVNVIAFKKGKALSDCGPHPYHEVTALDHITAAPVTRGRRAELPPQVALWMVRPFAVRDGLLLDPFAGSGVILEAGERFGMRTIGYEVQRDEKEPTEVAEEATGARSAAV